MWGIFAIYGKVRKSLRVNFEKTQGMQLLYGKKPYVLLVDPCDVCDKRVVGNYLMYKMSVGSSLLLRCA